MRLLLSVSLIPTSLPL